MFQTKMTMFLFLLSFVLHSVLVLSDRGDGADVIAAPEISGETFERKLAAGEFLLINFVGPGCKNCKDFAPVFNQVYTELSKQKSDINVAVMNNMEIVRYYDFQKLPSLIFFRNTVPILYEGHPEAEEIEDWLSKNMKIHGRYLNNDDFEHLTQASTGATTGDWLVQFCDPERPQCVALTTIWETVAYRLKGRINLATVDTRVNKALVKRFNIAINKTPTVILFHKGKEYRYGLFHFGIVSLAHFAEKSYIHVQGSVVKPPPAPFLKDGKMYRIHPKLLVGPSEWLDSWLNKGYKDNKALDVPKEWTAVDELTDNIAKKIKKIQPEQKGIYVIVIGVVLVLLLVFCKIFRRGSDDLGQGGPKKGV